VEQHPTSVGSRNSITDVSIKALLDHQVESIKQAPTFLQWGDSGVNEKNSSLENSQKHFKLIPRS